MESESDAPPTTNPMEPECDEFDSQAPSPPEINCCGFAPPCSPQTVEFECPSPGYNDDDSLEFMYGFHSPAPPYGYTHSPHSPESHPLSPPYSPPYSPKPLESEPPTTTDLAKSKPHGLQELLGQIGLHCYNLHHETNLQFLGVKWSFPVRLFGWNVLSEVEDPIRNSTCNLETRLFYHNIILNKGSMDLTITHCVLKPEVEAYRRCSERRVVDDLFKGDMRNWHPDDALTGSCNLQYYEMKESEVEQDKEWLHLYALLALFSSGTNLDKTEPLVELRKVVVQTTEDVEPENKAKATNAIFYISFKSSGAQDYNAIIRRTTVEWPQHMYLEVECV